MHELRGHRLRKGRYSEVGRIYLVTSVTHQRIPWFNSLEAGRIVVNGMRFIHQFGNAETLCYVVMPDHIHWLFQLRDLRSLEATVGALKGWTARQINRSFRRTGPVWQAGFHDMAVRGHEDVRAIARYVTANPLRAGLVDRIEEYSLWDAAWLGDGEVL